jgi:hypothetical protein
MMRNAASTRHAQARVKLLAARRADAQSPARQHERSQLAPESKGEPCPKRKASLLSVAGSRGRMELVVVAEKDRTGRFAFFSWG